MLRGVVAKATLRLQQCRRTLVLGAGAGPDGPSAATTLVAPIKESDGTNLAINVTRRKVATIEGISSRKGTVAAIKDVRRTDLACSKNNLSDQAPKSTGKHYSVRL